MYGYLSAKIQYVDAVNKEICLVANGIGFVVKSAALKVPLIEGSDLEVFVYTAVSESSITLWAFDTKEALQVFRLLISVSGIGPTSAQSILVNRTPADIVVSILEGQHQNLRVSGVGEKGAQKIVLELKSKIGKLPLTGESKSAITSSNVSEAIETLVSLGFMHKDVSAFFSELPDQKMETAQLVKEYLRSKK